MKNKEENSKMLALWRAVQKGDRAAFDEFYRSYVQRLYNYGYQLFPNSTLVEDSIQEVFINLWKQRTNLVISESPYHYVLLSLRRLILRKIQQRKKIVSTSYIEEEIIQFLSPVVEETSATLTERKKRVLQAVNQLPKRQKEAIFLKYYENLDYEEIANLMSLEIHSVYKLVSTGIKKLRSRLG